MIVLAVKFSVEVTQRGEFEETVGAAGKVFTTTVVAPAVLVHVPTFAVTLYVPAAAAVTFEIDGFWEVEVKLFGPVQEYVAPATVDAVRFKAPPTQTGVLEEAVGVLGSVVMDTVVVPAKLVQLLTVVVTLYVPASAAVVLAIVGFWDVEVKPFGPVQA